MFLTHHYVKCVFWSNFDISGEQTWKKKLDSKYLFAIWSLPQLPLYAKATMDNA